MGREWNGIAFPASRSPPRPPMRIAGHYAPSWLARQEVGHGDLGDDLVGEDQIDRLRLSEDRGVRVDAVGRVGIDLELAIDHVDDPVDGDSAPAVGFRQGTIRGEARAGNLDD